MDKPDRDIADLLALADGEAREASLEETEPEVAELLAQVRDIRSNLRALPDVPVSDDAWATGLALASDASSAAQHNDRAGFAQQLWRFRLATAASVFFASIAGVYFLFSDASEQHDGSGMSDQSVHRQFAASTTQLEPGGLQLAGLMNRSQELEQRLRGTSPVTQASRQVSTTAMHHRAPSIVELRLMGRLTDVDAQIGRLYEASRVDRIERQRLWTQRVSLLESLVAVRAGGDLGRPEVALSYEDMRSM